MILATRPNNRIIRHRIYPQNGEIMDLIAALTVFNRISETGSFSAVARETNTSQSAVTRLVGQLEAHFGVRLFHRTTRRLSLTEDGQDLLGHAHHLLEVAEGMEGALGRHRTSPTGLVRVGVTTAGATLMGPRLFGLLKQYPGLAVELVVRDQLGDMIEERLDVALQVGQPSDSSLMARAAGAFGRTLVAAPIYLERRGAPSKPADLAEHTCIIHESGPDSAVWRFEGPDGPEQVHVTSQFRANNAEVVHRAVSAGHGVSMVPEALIVDDIRAARLYRLLPKYKFGRLPAFVLYPSRRHLAPRTRVVIDFLIEQVNQASARLQQDDVWGDTDRVWLV
jgi:DNA-binding transcriptional LysR family regulator